MFTSSVRIDLMTTISMRQKDIRPAPARIEFKGMKFLITDRPSDATIQSYLMVSIDLDQSDGFCVFFFVFRLRLLEFDDRSKLILIGRSRFLPLGTAKA